MMSIRHVPRWYDRGDPAASDFTQADFTADSAWHTISFATIVPMGTKTVHLYIQVRDNDVNSVVQFRKKGNVNSINTGVCWVSTNNTVIGTEVELWLDSNREAEYKLSTVVWAEVIVKVRSYAK